MSLVRRDIVVVPDLGDLASNACAVVLQELAVLVADLLITLVLLEGVMKVRLDRLPLCSIHLVVT